MKKNCDNCDEICDFKVQDCVAENITISCKNWKPKTPKLSADYYEILRDCTLDSLIDDGKCLKAVQFYKKHENIFEFTSSGVKGKTPEEKLRSLFYYFKNKEDFQNLLEYLTDETLPNGAYIKKKTRTPKVGEIWKLIKNPSGFYGNMHCIQKLYSDYTYKTILLNKMTSSQVSFRNMNYWQYICDSEGLIQILNQIADKGE